MGDSFIAAVRENNEGSINHFLGAKIDIVKIRKRIRATSDSFRVLTLISELGVIKLTFMIKVNFLALQAQEVEIWVVLVLCNAEYLPSFQVQHQLPMMEVLLV
jgi:hypothetical protein